MRQVRSDMEARKPSEYWLGEVHADPVSLSLRIKALRDRLYLNQKEFARAVKAAQSDVSAWERGNRRPSAEALIRIGNLAHPADAIWFWRMAGINPDIVLSAVGFLLKEEGVEAEPLQKKAVEALGRYEWEVSLETAARLAGVTPAKIAKLIKSGEIKARKTRDTFLVEWISAALYRNRRSQEKREASR